MATAAAMAISGVFLFVVMVGLLAVVVGIGRRQPWWVVSGG